MMRFYTNADGKRAIKASVNGVAVFLDQFAITQLAKGDLDRRRRFTNAIQRGGDLLFSVSNAVEIVGPMGDSFDRIRIFLSDLGHHWTPLELDPHAISKLELSGADTGNSCISKQFIVDYFNARRTALPGTCIEAFSDDFFDLGWVMEWLAPQRASIIAGKLRLDEILRSRIRDHHARFKQDSGWLNQAFPPLKFDPRIPVTFTLSHLMRTLIVEAKGYQIEKGDGIDFCNAVIASAFATIATLDKAWKRRIETLPQRQRLARIYFVNELDALVDDLEKATSLASLNHRTQ